MKVNEIFTSIEGEGIRAGVLCTFIRFTGCNLRCSWCDTRYAFDDGTQMTPKQILAEIPKDCRYITITGGEPLIQDPDEMKELTDSLTSRGVQVNIETNGSMDFTPLIGERVIITADYKLPMSGQENKMNADILSQLREDDVLKFVIGSHEDLNRLGAVIDRISPKCHIFLSCAYTFGGIKAYEIVDWMKSYPYMNRYDIRMQIQMHKVIWDPLARGV